jgi:hypothetical protein
MKKSIVAATVAAVGLVAVGGASASGGSGSAAGTGWQSRAIARITAAEQAGKVSQAKGSAMIARVQAGHRPGAHFRRFVFRQTASYLGMSGTDLRTELRSGKSLAQVISGQGKSVSVFEQSVLAQLTARLDARPNLDPTRKRTILDKLPARLDKLVNRVFSAAKTS